MDTKTLELRKQKVLEAIIDLYITTGVPVGSRTLSKKFQFNISSATIRNSMAELEENGYITHPYTSAGRIPTDKGYRYYVDTLMHLSELPETERKRIKLNYSNNQEKIDDIISKTSKIISEITKCTSVVLYPKFVNSVFKHMELISIKPKKVLAVLITKRGIIKNYVLDMQESINRDELSKISNFLNHELMGLTIKQIKNYELKERDGILDSSQQIFENAFNILNKCMMSNKDERLYLDGTSYILEQPEFSNSESIKSIIRLFEQKEFLLNIINNSITENSGVNVYIGVENKCEHMKECSFINSNYYIADQPIGGLGIIGPKRMHYSHIISAINFIADTVSEIITQLEEY